MPTTQHRGATNMDIEEFAKQVQPRAKRSQLDPYKEQIFTLKARGYANWQIRDWLATVGIKCSQEAVRKFIKSRAEQGAVDCAIQMGAVDCAIQKPPTGSAPAASAQVEKSEGQGNAKKVGAFDIPVPKKFHHNPTPDDGILD